MKGKIMKISNVNNLSTQDLNANKTKQPNNIEKNNIVSGENIDIKSNDKTFVSNIMNINDQIKDLSIEIDNIKNGSQNGNTSELIEKRNQLLQNGLDSIRNQHSDFSSKIDYKNEVNNIISNDEKKYEGNMIESFKDSNISSNIIMNNIS